VTTFTTSDREEAEKRQRLMNELQNKELPPDWEDTSAPWPFTEDDVLEPEEVPKFKDE
jgi:hypothetical protein